MSSYAIGIAGYVILLFALVALIVFSHLPQSRVPTLGRMIATVRATRVGRLLLVLGWAWVGWHLFVR